MTARKRVGSISVALVAAALTTLAFIGSVAAKLTGEFTRFQHCPHEDSEVELLENPFLGLNCYVGSITKTARAPIATQPRAIGGNQTGIQLATTRTNALSRLTLSPA